MSGTLEEQINQLKQTITEIEAQRPILGDSAVETSLEPFRQKLAFLESQLESLGDEPEELPTRQRKLVTLLYMDVVGSTAMTQHLDPEDTLEIMDNALPRLAAPIESHGGHVTRYTGDGFKAVFGDPVAREDDPEQAIRAGMEILENSQKLAKEIEKEWGIEDFKVRIGIDTGLAALGGQTEAEDTVMGRVVNLAVRIESAAPPGGLLISHNTYRHVRGVFNVKPQEPITAKGFPEPVPVYLVESIKPRAFRVRTLGVEGVETRMIGRRTELDLLKDALLTAVEEREGQVITVSGEAGVGKSRLLYEFQNWIELLPQIVRLFQGRGRQESQDLPYSLLRDIFTFRFQILDDDTGEEVQRKIEIGFGQVFGTEGDGLMRAHIIGQLFGFDFSASPHLKSVLNDPEQLRNRGLLYLQEYFQLSSKENPSVILLEDIHWGDESSLDVVNRLGEHSPKFPFVIVCAARTILFERRPYWGEGQKYHTQLELRPLSTRESRQLVSEILKLVDTIPTELRELIVSGAEGNPFYLEELIKMLIEDGVIIPGEETWQVDVTRLKQVDVPSTLAGVLQARLDILPGLERMVLQQASVIGRLFWDRIIAYIQAEGSNGGDPNLIPQVLTSLRNRELVYRHEESAFIGAVEYLFKHDVLREVTYESVLKRLRKTYHGLVANWLITNCGDRIGEYYGLIADHLLMAGREKQACQYFIQAGEYALSSYANQEAEIQFSRALSLACEELDKSRVLEGHGESLSRLSRNEQAIQSWNEAIELNLKFNNKAKLAALYAKTSRAVWWLGDTPRGLKICLEGLKWIENEPGSHEIAQLLHETARAYNFNGKPEEAYKYCQKALNMAEQLGDFEVQADTLTTLGILSVLPSEKVIDTLTKAVELANKCDSLEIRQRANMNLGVLRFEITGDLPKVMEDYDRAISIAKQRGDLDHEFLTSGNYLELFFESNKLSEIHGYFHSYENLAAKMPETDMKNIDLLIYNADILRLHGDIQDSLELLREGRVNTQKQGNLQMLVNIDYRIVERNFETYWVGREPNWRETEEVINELIHLGEKGWSKALPLSLLAMTYTFQGRYQEAHQSLEAAKLIKDDFTPFWSNINVLKATAYISAANGHWEESIGAYENLIAIFSQKGFRWKHAHTLSDWGDTLVSRGETADLEAAGKLYNQAIEIYDDLEAAWHKEQVERRLEKVF